MSSRPSPSGRSPELDRADRGAHQAADLEAGCEEEPADLAVAALVEDDLEASAAAGRLAEPPHLGRARGLAVDHEAPPPHRLEVLLAREAGDGDEVALGDSARVHQALGEARVVAEQQQPLRVLVQAADGEPVAVGVGEQLEHGARPALPHPRDECLPRLVPRVDPRRAQIPPSGRNAMS